MNVIMVRRWFHDSVSYSLRSFRVKYFGGLKRRAMFSLVAGVAKWQTLRT